MCTDLVLLLDSSVRQCTIGKVQSYPVGVLYLTAIMQGPPGSTSNDLGQHLETDLDSEHRA